MDDGRQHDDDDEDHDLDHEDDEYNSFYDGSKSICMCIFGICICTCSFICIWNENLHSICRLRPSHDEKSWKNVYEDTPDPRSHCVSLEIFALSNDKKNSSIF